MAKRNAKQSTNFINEIIHERERYRSSLALFPPYFYLWLEKVWVEELTLKGVLRRWFVRQRVEVI